METGLSFLAKVLSQKSETEKLLDFCGLNWEDNCLEFYKQKGGIYTASRWQARKPIYRDAMYKWKNYEKHLGVLKELLANEIAEYEAFVV